MAYKYFGRLAGSTLATDAITLTSPANTTTPFTAVLPASKFIAYGENATSAAFNRALTALSVNTDSLAGTLDSPSLRYEVMEPSLQAGNPGYSALAAVAAGAQNLDLAAGVDRPITWTYVGLHKDLLSRHMQVERIGTRSDAQQLLAPADIYLNAALAGTSTSYFPTTTYTGTSDNALALKIPGVVAVATDLPPYGGAAAPTAVSSFDSDGCRLTNRSWEDLYARPGCLVSITGGAANRGLYRIASLSGGNGNATSKAVLTRAYTEVTVQDGTKFGIGDLVGWRPEPSNQGNAGTVPEYVHRAYVVFKFSTGNANQAVLYLSDVAGSEDLKIQGTQVAHKANPTTTGTSSFSRYGLLDLESGATQNSPFVIGTYLLNLATVGANPIAAHTSTIQAILPANHPVRFDTAVAVYNATVCAPPGYVLNPVVGLASNSLGGDFRIHTQVLTTVGENLRAGGGSASKGSFVPSTRLEFSPGYQSVMESMFSWLHRGDDGGTGAGPQVNKFSSTRQVLGEGLWYLVFTGNLPSIPAGTAIQIVPQPTYTAYAATVVRTSGTALWVKHVYLDGKQYGNGHPAIAAGGTLTYNNTTYTVASVWEPKLESTPGLYVPDEGLNAQYHNHYSANPGIRGNQGKGNRIKAFINRPITMELTDNAGQVAFQVESPRQANGQDYTVIRSGPVGMANTDMALEVVDGTTLRIKDSNAAAGVKFSDTGASNSGLVAELPQNILGAINGVKAGLGIMEFNGVISGSTPSDGAGTVDIMDVGTFVYQGLIYTTQTTQVPLIPNKRQFIVWTPGNGYDAQTNVPTFDQVPIAWTETTGGVNIVDDRVVDLRLFVRNVDRRVDLLVGSGPGCHFSTIGKAVEFVNAFQTTESSNPPTRSWRILVCGDTVETDVIKFRSDGVLIEGVRFNNTPLISAAGWVAWSGNRALFDTNGFSDIEIRNLRCTYNRTANTLYNTNLARSFLTNSSTQNKSASIVISDVQVSYFGNGYGLHAYVVGGEGAKKAFSDLRITGCLFSGASDFSIYLDGGVGVDSMYSVYIRDNRFFGVQTGNNLQWAAPQDACGIYVKDGTDVHISGNQLENSFGFAGVALDTCERVHVVDNHIDRVNAQFNGSALILNNSAAGIYVVDSLRAVIRGNHIKNVSADGNNETAVGIRLDSSDRCRVVENDVYALNVSNAAVTRGVLAGNNANYNIIDTNQTGGAGITVLGANNSIGAMNRDDL